MSSDVPGPWIRRPTSTSILLLAGLATPFLAPIALLVAVMWDLVTRTPRLRRTRLMVLISTLILIDLAGRVLVFGAWLISPVGTNVMGVKSQRRYRWIMTTWTRALIWAITRITPLPIDTSELDETLLSGNAIVVARHRSVLDAVYPAALFGSRGLTALYTLKEDLRWEPNMDIVGHRMGHVFVTRSPKDITKELEPIRTLAGRIDEHSVGVIFPEGTFFTEERKDRALKSIAKRNPERLEWAKPLNYMLPPRPAGTLALLNGAVDADVIVLGHVGFEPFGSLREIVANLGAQHSIKVKAWRFPRHTIPTADDERIEWLFQRWAELDAWITSHHPLTDQPAEIQPNVGS